jgi:acetylxylan esterase
MLVVHGTQDTLVVYSLLGMQSAQWSNVLGVAFTRNMTNTPVQSWTEMIYGDGTKLLGFSVQGAGHIPPFQEETVLKFFGIM